MNNNREIIFGIDKKGELSISELKELLKKWQEKLELNDWSLSVEIVEFKHPDSYRQSGDFIADPEKKEAQILMTNDPWRGDEEYTLLHELLHIVLNDYGKSNEEILLKNFSEFSPEHNAYLEKLENLVHHLTRVFLGRSDR